MTQKNEKNVCQPAQKLIFACSGAADVGEISDRAARHLTRESIGKMFCLAGIGGKIEPILKATASASKILAIDGCGLDCVKNCLEQAGINEYKHLRVTDMGLEKGKTPATDETVSNVATRGKELLS